MSLPPQQMDRLSGPSWKTRQEHQAAGPCEWSRGQECWGAAKTPKALDGPGEPDNCQPFEPGSFCRRDVGDGRVNVASR